MQVQVCLGNQPQVSVNYLKVIEYKNEIESNKKKKKNPSQYPN